MTLHDLLAEVERAKGPNRELDFAVATTLLGMKREKRGRDRAEWFYDDADPSGAARRYNAYLGAIYSVLPTYSRSLDACAALQERALPGWFRRSAQFPATGWVVVLTRTAPLVNQTALHPSSEPLAWLAAIIRAKIAMEKTDD